jgi:hypothetical protein
MTLEEKRKLVGLLHKYQDEQLEMLENNKEEIKIAEQQGKRKWDANLTFGNKAQYEHARIISTKLSVEISKEIPSYWEI